MARQPPPKGAATARGPRQLDPLPDERAQDGPHSARVAVGGDQAVGAPASKPLVLTRLDKAALAMDSGPSQDASDPADRERALAEGEAWGYAKAGRLEPMPAGFGVAAAAQPDTSPTTAQPTDDLEHHLMSTRSKLSSRGFHKDSRLRRAFDAQMIRHQANLAVRAPSAIESDRHLDMVEEMRPTTVPGRRPATVPDVSASPRGAPRSSDSVAAGRQKRAQEQKELVDAISDLRKAGPGGWDAPSFACYRRRFMSQGMPSAVKGLNALAAKSSRAALDAGAYRLPGSRNGQVRLPKSSAHGWIDYESLNDDSVLDQGPAPPLVVSAASACEVGLQLRRMYPHVQLFMSFEATDYTPGGEALAGADAARPFQQEMLLRTTLEWPVDKAAKHVAEPSNLRGKLTAKKAPPVLVAKEVVIFREGADKGYQFLPQAEQATCTVLVTGRSAVRPLMMPHSEIFAKEEDAMAYVDRLQIIGLSASALAAAGEIGSGGEVAKGKSFLVIAAQGLTDHADHQPRDSIAKLLQTWRRLYANMFDTVVVACGSVDSAIKLDLEINTDVYANALDGNLTKGSFAWRPKVCSLSVNPAMQNLAKQVTGGKVALPDQAKRGNRQRPSVLFDLGLSIGPVGSEAEALEVDTLLPSEMAAEDGGGGPRTGRRRSSLARITLIESMDPKNSSRRNSSSVWMRIQESKIRHREEEDAERNRQRGLSPTSPTSDGMDSRSFIAHRKHFRLGNAFEREYAETFKDAETFARDTQERQLAEVANIMSIIADTRDRGVCQTANAAALRMPKEILKEVVKAETRNAAQQTNASVKAEEMSRQLQGLAGDVGDRLKARQDEYSLEKKLKEQRLRGGPSSSFKWT